MTVACLEQMLCAHTGQLGLGLMCSNVAISPLKNRERLTVLHSES